VKNSTVAYQWKNFKERTIPASAPEVQIREIQRAFYAGAISFFSLVDELGSEDSTDETRYAGILELQDELKQFVAATREDLARERSH
jgi:hypothetical protein